MMGDMCKVAKSNQDFYIQLDGQYKHFCPQAGDAPIDETMVAFQFCECDMEDKELRGESDL